MEGPGQLALGKQTSFIRFVRNHTSTEYPFVSAVIFMNVASLAISTIEFKRNNETRQWEPQFPSRTPTESSAALVTESP